MTPQYILFCLSMAVVATYTDRSITDYKDRREYNAIRYEANDVQHDQNKQILVSHIAEQSPSSLRAYKIAHENGLVPLNQNLNSHKCNEILTKMYDTFATLTTNDESEKRAIHETCRKELIEQLANSYVNCTRSTEKKESQKDPSKEFLNNISQQFS